ncbi:MAG TPA: hypothetical protein VG125_29240 [Pirellulales bacterium]|jgi:hypothetical protein|nr:hypothetical protein [Pirellulales bacterium]
MPTTMLKLCLSRRVQFASLAAAFIGLAGCGLDRGDTYEVEVTDYSPPAADDDDLKDDALSDKAPPEFDASLVDRRPLDGWLVNSSAAVLRLDVPLVKPDREPELLVLHPSYAAALGNDPASRGILPSVNLIDGKAKQFDDGLCAALDQAYFQGIVDRLLGHAALVRRLLDEVDRQAGQKKSPAAPFLAAALELAGLTARVSDEQAKQTLLAAFLADETSSKPIGFYTWTDTLKRCFQFHRFLQREFGADELEIPLSLARALAANEELLADYRRAVGFYARLTNPHFCVSLADLVDGRVADDRRRFAALCEEKHVWHPTVAFFPPATSRETVLFEALFPQGLPADANLMKELVRRVRSGEVDLTPQPDSGWYDHQVFALESMLIADRGEERNKLLLTKSYKRRMLEAFQALLTKRRETHVRDLAKAASAAPRPAFVQPRLRVEPAVTYYLRTARAYRFLTDFLESALGRELLVETHGLTKDGPRTQDLWAELNRMRDLFYGLYLVSAEDIGLPAGPLSEGDGAESEQDRCYELAVDWLGHAFDDPDLAADTRVSVPLFIDRARGATRLWATLGVRLTRLAAEYARPPSIKPAEGEGDWSEPEMMMASYYLIPVDEFAEVELPGLRALSREEFRLVCDRAKTKQAILKELESR